LKKSNEKFLPMKIFRQKSALILLLFTLLAAYTVYTWIFENDGWNSPKPLKGKKEAIAIAAIEVAKCPNWTLYEGATTRAVITNLLARGVLSESSFTTSPSNQKKPTGWCIVTRELDTHCQITLFTSNFVSLETFSRTEASPGEFVTVDSCGKFTYGTIPQRIRDELTDILRRKLYTRDL